MPAQEFCWFSILAILAIPRRVKQAGVGFAFPMTRCSDDPMTRLSSTSDPAESHKLFNLVCRWLGG